MTLNWMCVRAGEHLAHVEGPFYMGVYHAGGRARVNQRGHWFWQLMRADGPRSQIIAEADKPADTGVEARRIAGEYWEQHRAQYIADA